mgnify:FL=1
MPAVGVESRIWEALHTRLAALTLSPPLLIATPNVTFPATGESLPSIYLRAHHMRATPDDVGISKWTERQGILQVDVCYSPPNGLGAATEIADKIAAHFPRGLTLGDIPVRIDWTPAIASPVDDTPHIKLPVSIRYRAFTP